MAFSLDQFRAFLIDAGIVSADELRVIENAILSELDTRDELSSQLVKRGKLTIFQADAIRQGNAHSLVMGNYLLLNKLGQGGMGVVYKARHRRMKREVALKILPKKLIASPDAVKRFQREVEATAQLEHPNIVTAHDADEANGVYFLVMQFVDGTDLSNVVKRRGRLPLLEALSYVLQAAKGLEYAHAKGIIHRDIKPANLFLSRDGTVKILDMGLARLDQQQDFEVIAPAASQLTGTGVIMGTVDYMAPEQALDAKHADGRADIYSLGCTLYFLLTGKPVYSGDTLMKRLVAHREESIPSLRQKRDDIPDLLDVIYQKMVAKNPANRYQSAAEVVNGLESIEIETENDIEAVNAVNAILGKRESDHFQDQLVATVDLPQVEEKQREDTALSEIDETARLSSISPAVFETEAVELAGASIPDQSQQRLTQRRKFLIVGGSAAGLFLLLGILIVFGKPALKVNITDVSTILTSAPTVRNLPSTRLS